MIPASPDSVLHLVARLSAVGICLESLELLSHGFRPPGVTDRGRGESAHEQAARWGTWTWHIGLPTLVAGRLVLGLIVLVDLNFGSSWKHWAAGLLIVSLLVCMMLRLTRGADSQLTLIVYSAIALTLLSDTPVAAAYCLYFLTLQLCFAYFAAGYHKLRSRAWRSGAALPGSLSTRLFGSPRAAAWLDRHRSFARSLSWAAMVLEVSFPLVLVAPREVCLFYFAFGILFHLSTALTMGLNKFIWAFLALYPAAVFCTTGLLPVVP
jgi:hypothetical protein